MKRLIILSIGTLWLIGCVPLQAIQTGTSVASLYYSKKVYEASECDWVEPIYLEGDVEGLTDEDLRQIVNHNDKTDNFCK